jgi:hypothetical protein
VAQLYPLGGCRLILRVILALIAAISLVSCVTSEHAVDEVGRPAVVTVYNSRVNPNEMFGLQTFHVGSLEFSEIADFQRFICSLPKGSVVKWVSSGFRFEHIPLQHSLFSIAQFTEFCRGCDITFVYVFRY